jgi:hypothetical protein
MESEECADVKLWLKKKKCEAPALAPLQSAGPGAKLHAALTREITM